MASFITAYHLVLLLSLLQIAIGLSTLFSYGIHNTVVFEIYQAAPTAWAFATAGTISRMLRLARHPSPDNSLSRVDQQINALIYVAVMWLLCAECVPQTIDFHLDEIFGFSLHLIRTVELSCIPPEWTWDLWIPLASSVSALTAAYALNSRSQSLPGTPTTSSSSNISLAKGFSSRTETPQALLVADLFLRNREGEPRRSTGANEKITCS
ncbi:hypothetical protein R3P38DRAFT_493338 [Favolaschia claudopus]|uniref:Vomeronasal type-1 receptor n=1 Tax=Favolaschia claudopus TaxID=2862362 RepID=A0AAW0CLC9_9AGAR